MIPDDEDEHWQEDEVQAAEAVLERHESELGLDAAEVHLHHVHVGRVENQEDLATMLEKLSFGDFRRFSAKKLAFFLKTNVLIFYCID
jgi:hypothetical protein